MVMTNEEILRSFRQASKPTKQVQVLADLNGTTVEEIKRILREQGVDARCLPRERRSEPTQPKAAPTPPEDNAPTAASILGALSAEEAALLDCIRATEKQMSVLCAALDALQAAHAALKAVYKIE